MTTNTLIIVTGYASVSPKPSKRAYLNVGGQEARQRFLADYPNARDIHVDVISFTDELTISPSGTISSTLIASAY